MISDAEGACGSLAGKVVSPSDATEYNTRVTVVLQEQERIGRAVIEKQKNSIEWFVYLDINVHIS